MSPSSPDEQDAADMARLAAGHDDALNALMERHGQRLFHFLIRSLGNEEDAADLAQETFVRVFQNRKKFDPRQKFSTWLYTIAANLVRDRFRWRARHPQVSLDAETETQSRPGEMLPAPDPSPARMLENAEQADAVRKAVSQLPDELRQPLVLAVYNDMPQAEIAQVLKCSAKAVEMRIYRARQQLRQALAPMLH